MDYRFFTESLTQSPHVLSVEGAFLSDENLEVQGAQLIRTQIPGMFSSDFIFVGFCSELPSEPSMAPHDCVVISDRDLPEAYRREGNANIVLVTMRETEAEGLLYLLNHVQFILADEFRYYRAMDRIMSAQQSKIGIQQAVSLIERLIVNPVVLLDDKGAVLAMGDHFQFLNEDLCNQIQTGKLEANTLRTMERQSVYEPLSSNYQELAQELAWDRTRYCCVPIRVDGLYIAELITENRQTPFHYSTIRMMRDIVRFLTETISHQIKVNDFDVLLHNLLFANLLEYQGDYSEELLAKIKALRWRECQGMRLLCCQGTDTNLHSALTHFLSAYPGSRWALVDGYLLVLFYAEDVAMLQKDIGSILQKLNLKGGLSWPFASLLDLRYAYRQAKAALDMSTGFYTDYASVFVSHIVSLPLEEQIHFLHPSALLLEEYDKGHDGNYVETLEAYLAGSEQPAEVAATLFIHRSTLFYRINRTKELANIELKTGEERLNVLLSLRILKNIRQQIC